MTEIPSRDDMRQQRKDQIDQRQRVAEDSGRRRQRNRRLRTGGIIGVAVALLVGVLSFAVLEATAPMPGDTLPDEGRSHVELGSAITYSTNPPASGPHYPVTARWSFNDSPLQPGFWVHNLEHGGITILYRCPADCTELKQQLKGLMESLPKSARYGYVKLVIAPDDTLPGAIAAMAWNHRIMLDKFDSGTLTRFYQAYVDKGPEDAP
ncbi:MAG: DUF3105 domain-containing protein [Dehalococcoidia bacterium]|nr:DUF3105 domain-containing protein [Dehalococcoidia bacterium]